MTLRPCWSTVVRTPSGASSGCPISRASSARSSTSNGTVRTASTTTTSSTISRAAGVTPVKAGGVPVPLRQPLDRCRRGRDRGRYRTVLQRAIRVRRQSRRAQAPRRHRLEGRRPALEAVMSLPRRPGAVGSPAGPTARRGQPGDHRCARRSAAVGLRGDRGGDVPHVGICLQVGVRGGEGVHRRHRPLRLLPLRQPDDLDVRGAAAADRGRAGLLCDGDGNGGCVHVAGRAAGHRGPVGRRAQPVRIVLRGVQRDPAALGCGDGVRRR